MSCESLSSCGDSIQSEPPIEKFESNLLKWTNFFYGWQERFFVLESNILNYYKSKNDIVYGSRGCISLSHGHIITSEYDELRFDICSKDCVWYIRASSVEDKIMWISHLNNAIIESGYGSELGSTRKSSGSINSQTLSTCSLMENHRLMEKKDHLQTIFSRVLWQMELFSRLLSEAGNFCQLTEVNNELAQYRTNMNETNKLMGSCVEIIDKYEGHWREKFDKERAKVKQLKKELKHAKQYNLQNLPELMNEGTTCPLQESEFFDAVDSAVDFLDSNNYLKFSPPMSSNLCPYADEISRTLNNSRHMWANAIENAVYLKSPQDEMQLFRIPSDLESYIDSFMLVLRVKNFTAKEITQSFFDIKERVCWLDAVERTETLESYGKDTTVFYELYQRMFPISQRDLVTWSHIAEIDSSGYSEWTVINKSCDHSNAPCLPGVMRVKTCVVLWAKTKLEEGGRFGRREDIVTDLSFITNVNLNGWISPHVVNAVAQRLWPRGIKRFVDHMDTHYNDDILL